MGLWPWLTSQIFTPKFWKLLKTEGALLTYTRGHKAVMNTHTVGGNSQHTKLVGRDEYGNLYYEDFDALRMVGWWKLGRQEYYTERDRGLMVDKDRVRGKIKKQQSRNVNQRRWVEYNNYTHVRSHNGDTIPPKWHGWLHYQYDDVPHADSDSFHEPYFRKPHLPSNNENGVTIYLSRECNAHPEAATFNQQRMERYAASWEAKTMRRE